MKLSDNSIKSLITAGLCTVWMLIANRFSLIAWAGFAGCTSYFACSKQGMNSIKDSGLAILSGSLYALFSMYILSFNDRVILGLCLTFITTFLMCFAGKSRYLSFVPAAFVGSFSTFAASGNLIILPSMLLGVLLGYTCDTLGEKITQHNF